ncbi:hypothetical protein TRFO_31701 [Tritrichomonas foetus]|uniref:Raptor N-terminal CASPase-like domain-containing protein n=1 Tax=Tritrichomonas foetus TaxID=1144522 RepID=A0A1J4JQT2_9EUKA|nr:hypothetical protein TRFO_31701 [Tritrichomonas foetus]|eukprot:OHT01473.1 hypothetical protein TRFO_31701 [Tritrichomonas foetus]
MFNPTPHHMKSPMVFNRQGGPQQITSSSKTKHALAFLCLFDGLRTPSIRRLVRKPRTICMKPLLTFDPSFYAPSSKSSLQETYLKSVNCPCEIAVDPSVQTVLNLLRRHTTSMPPQRVILHYFGHGCHPPMADGCLFFFTDDRARYKPIKIQNIVNACACPLCIILDCPFAGVLLAHLSSRADIFAFCACSACEQLPLSTDAPMDLFSSCLLKPFDTALFWRMRQNSSIYEEQKMPPEECCEFLNNLFMSLLDSILFDTQTKNNIESFTRDPSIAQLTRGFVLAQRVMLSFNLHPIAQPDLKPMASHPLWEFWDVALDFSVTMEKDEAISMIFKLFISSFKKFPKSGYFPLFSFLMTIQDYHESVCQVLFDYMDSTEGAAENAARSSIPKTIMKMQKPSAISLLILAKILSTGSTAPFDQQTPFNFASSSNNSVIKAGMLAMCCALNNQSLASFNRLTNLCIDHAVDCAPYSALFLGLLIERGGRLMNLPPFCETFVKLIKEDTRDDVRAASVFVLGVSKDTQYIEMLVDLLADKSPFVRVQSFFALLQMMQVAPNKEIFPKMKALQNDTDQICKNAVIDAIPTLELIEANADDAFGVKPVCFSLNGILQNLTLSVRSPGFMKRYEKNVFELKQK